MIVIKLRVFVFDQVEWYKNTYSVDKKDLRVYRCKYTSSKYVNN